ncbi:hypothetical protein [Pantoea stewartii]|uniref:hypothetical protein n=1 Tax=Pantoea stewartii TaxID=66269 RepID=UPI0006903C7A|nr:hypothetical protein [Pantoea stewartii]
MQQRFRRVIEIKAQTDHLILQLSEGEFRSLDTYINNFEHLQQCYCSLGTFLDDDAFLAWLGHHHAILLSQIAMTGKVLLCLQNFAVVMAHRQNN